MARICVFIIIKDKSCKNKTVNGLGTDGLNTRGLGTICINMFIIWDAIITTEC